MNRRNFLLSSVTALAAPLFPKKLFAKEAMTAGDEYVTCAEAMSERIYQTIHIDVERLGIGCYNLQFQETEPFFSATSMQPFIDLADEQ
jgi:hypothetical protein